MRTRGRKNKDKRGIYKKQLREKQEELEKMIEISEREREEERQKKRR